MEIGSHVVFVDPVAKEHDAIVTAVHGTPTEQWTPSINLVYVSDNDAERDQYGRQIVRKTSIVNERHQGAHGNYWKAA